MATTKDGIVLAVAAKKKDFERAVADAKQRLGGHC